MKKIIIANWKMNPQTLREAVALAKISGEMSRGAKKAAVVICPPSVFLSEVAKALPRGRLLGAQDVFWKEFGAYTGEVSPAMLKNLGVRFVLVGHSERRELGEGNDIVNKKVRRALESGLTPVLCIGERSRDEDGIYLSFLKNELEEGLRGVKKNEMARMIIAYEPLWAIGEGAPRADTPDETFEVAIFIRKILNALYGKDVALAVPVLYGGSVNAKNAGPFLERGGVQGLLVGRSSLAPKEFGEIIRSVEAGA